MRCYLQCFITLLLVVSLLHAHAAPVAKTPNTILVKYSRGQSSNHIAAAHAKVGGTVLKSYDIIPWQLVKLPAGMTAAQGVAKYKTLPGVLAVEANTQWSIDASPRNTAKLPVPRSIKPGISTIAESVAITPNDPRFIDLWGMTKIQAPTAWNTSTGSREVVVAILDTGIDYNHPDLAANLWSNPLEIAGNGIDDDGNGYIDDIFGINAITGSGDPLDDHNHGSHVAGTIGAVGANGIGVVGVNWQVSIMALKGFNASGSGSTDDFIESYQYMLAMKARGVNIRAVNNSWGGSSFSQALMDAISAAGTAGIVSCCAAGNTNTDTDANVYYPAGYNVPSVIAVAASDINDNRASFSNYGATTVDLAAPGVDITSTIRNNAYQSMNGTSMATPHVAGAIALLASTAPSLTPIELINQLLTTVDVLPNWSGVTLTGGRLNLARAIATLGLALENLTVDDAPGAIINGNNNGVFEPGERVALNLQLRNYSPATVNNISVTISSLNPAVTIFSGTSIYANLPTGSSGNNAQSLSIGLDVNFPDSPTPVDLAIVITSSLGTQIINYRLVTGVTQQQTFLYETGETGASGWTQTSSSAASWSLIVDAGAKSPTHSFYGPDADYESTHSLLSPQIALPNSPVVTLAFWHRYQFENDYDGGKIEISTNQGSSWLDLGMFITQGGYTHLEIDGLLGGAGWSGNSPAGMTEVLVNLTQFAGQTVQLRWRIGTDYSEGSTGWYVDDILISEERVVPPNIAALQVLTPPAGDVILAGTLAAINWLAIGNVGPNVSVTLFRGENVQQTISAIAPTASGAVNWNVGELPDGDDYRVRVTSLSEPSCWDFTNDVFRIRHLWITAPNQQSVVRLGDNLNILWQSSPNLFQVITLDLYKNGQLVRNIATDIPNTGAYSWAIPRTIPGGNDYAIRISGGSPAYTDTSAFIMQFALYQPDVAVKREESLTFLGENYYSPDGSGQLLNERGQGPFRYVIRMANAGSNIDRLQLNVSCVVRSGNGIVSNPSLLLLAAVDENGQILSIPGLAQTIEMDMNPGAFIDCIYELENTLFDSSITLEATVTSLQGGTPALSDLARIILWNPAPLTAVKLEATPSSLQLGQSVTLTATPTGGVSVQYQFFRHTGTTWQSLTGGKYLPANSCTYTPSSAGSHLFRVNAREVGSTTYVPGEVTVPVYAPLSGVSLKSSTPVFTGSPVLLTATPTGGTSVQYQFFRRSGSTWISLTGGKYLPATTCSYTPTAIGAQLFRVNARETGTTAYFPGEVTVQVYAPLNAVALAASPSPTITGKAILLTATPTGGAVVEYQFYRRTGTTWESLTGGKYLPAKTCSYTPTATGSQLFRVNAREVGTTTYYPGEVTVQIYAPISAVTLSAKPSPSVTGKPIELTAAPTGGAMVEYQFYRRTGSTWESLTGGKYLPAKTCSYTPTATGSQLFRVNAREAGTSTYYPGEVTVQVYPPLIGATLAANPSPVAVNKPVLLTATPVGGAVVEYHFYRRVGSTWESLTGGKYLPANTCSYTPTATGPQLFRVNAREVGTTTYFPGEVTVQVNPVLSGVALAANPLAIFVGQPTLFTATPTGGGAVEYQFFRRVGTTWESLTGGKYLPANTCNWTPAAAGSVLIRVNAREVGTTAYFPGEVTVQVSSQ